MASNQHLSEIYKTEGVEDLSEHHQPICKEFDAPVLHSKEDVDKYKITDEQINYFNTNGYLMGVPVLNDAQVELLKQELKSFSDTVNPHKGMGLFHEFHANESGDPNNVLLHCLGHWRITPGFHDLVFHPAISVVCSQLLENRPIRFWHDQLFAKPAHFGGCVS